MREETRPFPLQSDSDLVVPASTASDLEIPSLEDNLELPTTRLDKGSFARFLSSPSPDMETILALRGTQEFLLQNSAARSFLENLFFSFSTVLRGLPFLGRGFDDDISHKNEASVKANIEAVRGFSNEMTSLNPPEPIVKILKYIEGFLIALVPNKKRIVREKVSKFLPGVYKNIETGESSPDYSVMMDIRSNLALLRKSFPEVEFEPSLQSVLYWTECLLKMVSIQEKFSGQMSYADFAGKEDGLHIEDLHNPNVLSGTGSSLPQRVLDIPSDRKIVVVNGVLGSGKTMLIRSIVYALIFNQLGSKVFGQNARLPVVSKVLSQQARPTSSKDGFGRYEGELQELRGLFDQCDGSSVVLLDEMLSSVRQNDTTTGQAIDLLRRFGERCRLVLLATHDPALVEKASKQDGFLVLGSTQENGGENFQFEPGRVVDPEYYRRVQESMFQRSFGSQEGSPVVTK